MAWNGPRRARRVSRDHWPAWANKGLNRREDKVHGSGRPRRLDPGVAIGRASCWRGTRSGRPELPRRNANGHVESDPSGALPPKAPGRTPRGLKRRSRRRSPAPRRRVGPCPSRGRRFGHAGVLRPGRRRRSGVWTPLQRRTPGPGGTGGGASARSCRDRRRRQGSRLPQSGPSAAAVAPCPPPDPSPAAERGSSAEAGASDHAIGQNCARAFARACNGPEGQMVKFANAVLP